MRIGILGSGVLGKALEDRLGAAGHDVLLSMRGSYEAAAQQPVVFLAIAWPHALSVVRRLHDLLQGRVLVDCTNPEGDDGGLAIGWTDSGAETIARAIPSTHVVKAFHALDAEHLHTTLPPESRQMTVLHCGDDALAKATTAELIESCGFDPFDAGPLSMSRYLEPMAMLSLNLGVAWSALRQGDNEAACETCGRPASLVSREKHVLCGTCFFLESQSRLAASG